ncbi:MAG: hypothetical protein J6S28_06855 [Clostridia bacterium]|nr:hypothetical protein [Clostridia bacterium]
MKKGLSRKRQPLLFCNTIRLTTFESFRPPFSKGGWFQGQRPWSPPQRRNFLQRHFFGSFFVPTCSKKERNEIGYVTLRKFSPFFFDGVAAKKNQKNGVKEVSRLRARPRAARPWMGGRFLQKATQKLSK